MILEANPIYHATEGGAMPSTIERVSNYTPLNTSSFDDLLDEQDNNLQAAMETIDEHHPGGYVREVLGAARTYYVRYNVGHVHDLQRFPRRRDLRRAWTAR